MGLFTFIICLLILLLLLIVIGTVQQFSLWVVTRKKYEFVVMIIPAFFSLLAFGVTTLLTCYILSLLNINIVNLLYSKLMNWEYSFNSFIGMILGLMLSSIIYILLQAFCLKLVNIDYKKIYEFIKYKILKKEQIKELSSSETANENDTLTEDLLPAIPETKTSFFNYLAASLFTFALFFFSIFLLIYIGIIIGEKYVL